MYFSGFGSNTSVYRFNYTNLQTNFVGNISGEHWFSFVDSNNSYLYDSSGVYSFKDQHIQLMTNITWNANTKQLILQKSTSNQKIILFTYILPKSEIDLLNVIQAIYFCITGILMAITFFYLWYDTTRPDLNYQN